MSNSTEIILCWIFVGVLWILSRHLGYREGFKDGYEQGEKDFKKPWNREGKIQACNTCGNHVEMCLVSECYYKPEDESQMERSGE